MTAKQLIEDLQQAPPDSEICFQMNGIYPAQGIEIGRMADAPTGYVMLLAAAKAGKHRPPRHSHEPPSPA